MCMRPKFYIYEQDDDQGNSVDMDHMLFAEFSFSFLCEDE